MVWREERWKLWVGVVVGVAALATGIALISRLRGTARGVPADVDDGIDWLAARDYERLTGIARESYEQRLLAEAQSSMMGEWAVEPSDGPAYPRVGVLERGSVDDVRLEANGTEAALVVRFRSHARPGCVFGWRIPIWPVPAPNDPEMGTPEGHASILSLHLVELVEAAPGLPAHHPDGQGVTWVGKRRPE